MAGAVIASAVLGAVQLLGARSTNPDGMAAGRGSAHAPSPSTGIRASAPHALPAAESARVPPAPPARSEAVSETLALPSSSAQRSTAPGAAPVAERKPAPSSQPAPSPERNASASLQLTSDPPASVGLRGPGQNRRLSTPVRELRLPAGAYTVTFESATYGVPVSTRVVIEEGTRRSVHADFREAEPKITVR